MERPVQTVLTLGGKYFVHVDAAATLEYMSLRLFSLSFSNV